MSSLSAIAIPHLTITRFAAPAEALPELKQEMYQFADSITSLHSWGLRFTPDAHQNEMWVDLQFLKSPSLSELQASIAKTDFAHKYAIHNKQGDIYLPHCTLTILEGKIIPVLDISSFNLFHRDFEGLRLAVGINGDHLTLATAQFV